MTPEGKVLIRIHWDGRRINGCEVDSRRPVDACRALVGRPVEDALALVPRLYTLCGRAQSAAAACAVDAAAGRVPSAEALLGRRLAVLGETAVEYLWRFFIDLPQALGEPPQPGPVAALRGRLPAPSPETVPLDPGPWRAFAQALRQTLADALFGADPMRAVGGDPGAFRYWHRAGMSAPARWVDRVVSEGFGGWGRSAVALMPAVGAQEAGALAQAAADPAFARLPAWEGAPRETGALARCRQAPLVAALYAAEGGTVLVRLAARLVELVEVAAALERLAAGDARGGYATAADATAAGAAPRGGAAAPAGPGGLGAIALGDGVGAGWTETARGLLIHRAALNGERVTGWSIVAPTEWNFHPHGPLPAGLVGVGVDEAERLARGVRLCVLALDPCVAYDLEVQDA